MKVRFNTRSVRRFCLTDSDHLVSVTIMVYTFEWKMSPQYYVCSTTLALSHTFNITPQFKPKCSLVAVPICWVSCTFKRLDTCARSHGQTYALRLYRDQLRSQRVNFILRLDAC
ncbi:hypothetical protein K439DRAFT_601593 [Ramaria rubella]|nr:hypothetical protein K439DRAFT_601593 [Ramaria rubella]